MCLARALLSLPPDVLDLVSLFVLRLSDALSLRHTCCNTTQSNGLHTPESDHCMHAGLLFFGKSCWPFGNLSKMAACRCGSDISLFQVAMQRLVNWSAGQPFCGMASWSPENVSSRTRYAETKIPSPLGPFQVLGLRRESMQQMQQGWVELLEKRRMLRWCSASFFLPSSNP